MDNTERFAVVANVPSTAAFLIPNQTPRITPIKSMNTASQLRCVPAFGAYIALFLFCILPYSICAQSVTLSNAVDAPQLTWTTGGNVPWIGQTNVTRDGVDAAQSGVIADNQESWIQTTVVGPATMTFWWRVSSELGYDYLEFYLNAVRQSGPISGELNWLQRTFNLGDGSQTLRWRYTKDRNGSSGQDRGWVDMVSFGPPSGPPIILTQPASQAVFEGATVTFNVIAYGALPLTYQWFKDTNPLIGATNRSLNITDVQASDAARYSVTVSNTLGSATSTLAMLNMFGKGITLTNPTPANGESFGFAVAAVGSDRVLIGAYGAANGGAAYLFSTNGTLLTAFANPTPAVGDEFGLAVSVVGSERVIIGAGGDGTGANRAGAAYLFSTSGTLLTTFANPTPAIGDTFGAAVAAVGSNGIIIGAPYDNTGASRAGAAYLFSTNGTLLTTITNPTPAIDDAFGRAVAALGGDRVIVGTPQDKTGGGEAGAVYLFSTSGTLLTTITNPTPGGGDWFGEAVAAVGSDRVVVTAPNDIISGISAGAAYLFSTNGTLLTTITNPTPDFSDEFGSAVAAVGSDRFLIGASSDNTGAANAGAAYLFSTDGTLLTTFTNFIGGTFGAAVAASGTDWVLVGAQEVAYLFRLANGPAMIIAQPQSRAVVVGASTTLSVTADGAFPLLYQWFKDGTPLAGAINRSYNISNAQSNNSGAYWVVVSNALGSATSSNAILSVLPWSVSTQPISLNLPTPGAISHVAELDEWTFFGRGGQTVAVVVDTGGINVAAPRLNYAEVRLLAPSSNLLARASNSVAGLSVVLTTNVLPVDGIYRVQIHVPLNQEVPTGNYRVTVWEATPIVSSLLLNQIAYGNIATPYSVEQWNFSALAGQQVRFDLINVSAAGIRFDLRGPSGWIGFSNLITDSGLVSLPANGIYSLVARGTGVAADISYAFKLIETTQTVLPLGTNFIGQFSGSGQAQIFKITVTNSGPLRITLLNSGTGNRAELYVGRNTPPTRGRFDVQSATGPGANRELLIPSAPVGDFYILIYGDSITTPGQFTIRASSLGVALTGSTPDKQANNSSFAMTLTGAGFEPGDTVALLASGGGVVATATNVSLDTYTQLTATFPPVMATAGFYSVRVTQLDGDTATLTNVFEVLAAGQPRLETRLILPGRLGRSTLATIHVEYANTGNASMEAPLLNLKSNDPDGSDKPILTLDESRLVQSFWSAGLPPGTAHEIFILASGEQPGVLNPGERRMVPVYYLGLLEPWNTTDSRVELEIRYWTATDTSPIDWAARKELLRPPTLDSNTWSVVYANLTSGLTNTGNYVRMLGDNARFLGRLGQTVTDVDKLWIFEIQQAWGYSPVSELDSVTDTSMPAPGVSLEFWRRFSNDLGARNSVGWFGQGWYSPWQLQLVVENGGDLVRLVGEAGSASVFTRDIRVAGRYFSGAGDSSTLTDLGGGVFELREPDGTVTRFRADGRIGFVQDVNGNRVTAGYDGSGKITSLTHSSGGSIVIGYNGSGIISSVADSAGRTNTYAYSGNYLQSVTTSDGKVTTYTYETGGNNAQRHALKSVTRGGTTRTYTFDTRGRLANTFVAGGEQLVNFKHDTAGGVYVADASGTNALFFDHNGQLAKTQDPLGNITTSEFDGELRLKRLVTPTGESQSFTWCNCGSPTSITDELGQTSRFAYDNPFRRLTSFADAKGNTTSYTYDTNGNLLATIYPDNSIESFGGYTATGLPGSFTNRRSQPTTYTYAPAGQMLRQSFTNGSYNEFFYDPRGNLTNVTEHLASGANKVTTYLYAYTSSGDRLRKVIYPNSRWVEFFYDGFGRRERMTDVTGQDLRYNYDVGGQLWRLRDATNAVIVEYLYNAAGRLQRINKGNGTYTTYDYDAAGQLLHLTNFAPNATVNSRFDYTYDRRGRRTAMGTVDGDWTYDYDATGQLIRARLVSTNPQITNQDLQYNYDALGNRATTLSNSVTTVYGANNLNQYTNVGGVAYQYDGDGNLTFDGVRTFIYDIENQLVQVSGPEVIAQYEYDAFGNRIASVFNGQRTEYLIDPSGFVDVVAEHDGMGTLTARSVNALGLVGSTRDSFPFAYLDFDGQMSTAGVSDQSGQYVNRYAYEPHGMELVSIGVRPNPFRHVGQLGVMSMSSGESFARARSYSRHLGRFLAPDPSGLAGGSGNLYRLAENSPIDFVDPDGLSADQPYKVRWKKFKQIKGWFKSGETRHDERTIYLDESLKKDPKRRKCVLAHEREHERIGKQEGCVARNASEVAATRAGFLCAIGTGDKKFAEDQIAKGVRIYDGWDYACDRYNKKSQKGAQKSPKSNSDGNEDGTFGDKDAAETTNSTDPNEKLGASGVGSQNWVTADDVIPYRINFENLSSATAPAQEVVITDQLNTNLNWRTFQLTEIGFGDVMIPVPPGLQYYETTVQMTCCGDPFEVQIQAGINPASGSVQATFRSINAATSLPPPISVGFLPPEDGTGRGQGHINYLINAKTNLPTGTQIRNVALITFDRQQSIATDQIDPQNPGAGIDPNKQALNTIDAGAPTSSVVALPAESGRAINVRWSGQDDAGGSGIATFDVFVSTNGGPFTTWVRQTTNNSAWFVGQAAQRYSFYSVAKDQVGNVELPPATPDAFTHVVTNAPMIIAVDGQQLDVGAGLVISNQVLGLPSSDFVWSFAGPVPSGLTMTSTNGVLRWTPGCSQGNTTNQIAVLATERTRTNISDLAVITMTVKECVAPQVGRLVLRSGNSGRLPIDLVTSLPLTNLVTLVSLPPGRFTNIGVEALATQICLATVQATNSFPVVVGDGAATTGWERYVLSFGTCTNLSLIGTQQIAWLVLTAATNPPSAFVPVEIGPSIGVQPGGGLATNYVTRPGTIVVVDREPLLEASRTTNGLVQLTLYSQVGVTNRIQSALSLPVLGSWTEWGQVVPSNLLQNMIPMTPTNGVMIFRAVRP